MFRATNGPPKLDLLRKPACLVGLCALVLAGGCPGTRAPIHIVAGRVTLGTAVVRCERMQTLVAGGQRMASLQLLADADCAATQGVFLELNAMEAGGKHALLKKTPLPDVTLERIAQKPITTPWFVKPAPQTVVEIVIYANCPPPQSAQGMTSCMLP